MFDAKNNAKNMPSLAPETRTASADGTGVDTAGYNAVTAVIQVGLLTMGEFAFKLLESDDDVSYSEVADADLIGTEPTVNDASDDEQCYRVGYKGSKRYVRVDLDVTAQSPSITTGLPCAASIELGRPAHAPAS